mmetsp:Transcript_36684/g.39799  ORF Transcript_36684/g.39799 Transcript_36684/m.39799 type:complete len:522 (-) Transcript_36684:62-1627(-)
MVLCHRKAKFKQTITADKGRRRRKNMTLSIRKQKKDLQLKKKRRVGSRERNNPTFSNLKAILFSPNSSEDDVIYATQGIRRLFSSENNLHIQEINDGIISILVRNLTCNIYQTTIVIYESVWALTNIASTSYSMDVVKAGAIRPLVDLLVHDDAKIREQAIWCLGNIAGEGVYLRDQILQESAIESLVMNLNDPQNMSLLGNAVWTTSNLCRGTPSPPKYMTAPVIQPLVSLLDRPITKEIVIDILWALSYLSDGDDTKIELVFSSGVTHKLMRLLEGGFIPYKKMIIRILGNFVSGNESHTQGVIDSGVLDYLAGLMGCQSRQVRKESCWLASNIACGSQAQITKLVRKKLAVQQFVLSAMNDYWDVRQEAIWTLTNICMYGNRTHVLSLVQAGGFEPLVMVLSLQDVDLALLVAALDAVKNVLEMHHQHLRLFEEYDGIDYLEGLQVHPNTVVYDKVVDLIGEFFGVVEDEDQNLVPETNENDRFMFGISGQTKTASNGLAQHLQQMSIFGHVSTNQLS